INHLEDLAIARPIQTALKGFYGVIKSMERYVRLTFITGVSKFSRVSLFSELNNLTDLTMRTSFGTAFGITEAELRHYFVDYIAEFAQKEGSSEAAFLDKVRLWYDGFCFAAEAENVYNPFSTMQLFDGRRFSNYWFESGTPTFLIKRLHQANYDISEFDQLELGELAFSTYDIDRLALVPLLFQTGYLTVKGYNAESRRYTLSYPNYEVENAFITYLLDAFSYQEQALSEANVWRLIDALRDHNLEQFFKILKIFFANIDYDLHLRNEKYYQTIFYLIFMLMGLKIQAETKTNDGRIDAVIEVKDRIYIFEFKLDKNAQTAIDQLIDKEYAQKYSERGKTITQVGVNFNSAAGQVSEWQIVTPA
ncbi:MAG: AAA family ATPase, partial [Caldilineaceae bacterium]|nr:AAA family ATPase [Caldilineaceae bacterium]